ncbi:MAG: GxxExxY protein [bacterium]
MNTELIYKEEAYAIVGACLEVYNIMGSGFLEGVYQKCLEHEFSLRGIPFVPQRRISLFYKGHDIEQDYIPDFVCYDKIILELKAVSTLNDEFRCQMLNYLNATKFELGLLVNFGHFKTLERERLVLTSKVPF